MVSVAPPGLSKSAHWEGYATLQILYTEPDCSDMMGLRRGAADNEDNVPQAVTMGSLYTVKFLQNAEIQHPLLRSHFIHVLTVRYVVNY